MPLSVPIIHVYSTTQVHASITYLATLPDPAVLHGTMMGWLNTCSISKLSSRLMVTAGKRDNLKSDVEPTGLVQTIPCPHPE
mmetsp:Transcript_4585/g.7855  ORF Transcript_4585/g.7855 Transcript_4585/m.7855 type:complete len:82 (-) Transcript_4585:1337-1582(-)